MHLKFAGEVLAYWTQHILIFFLVPPFLIYSWGNYVCLTLALWLHYFFPPGPHSLEPFGEWAWCCFAGVLFGIHHHYVLQPVAIVSSALFCALIMLAV